MVTSCVAYKCSYRHKKGSNISLFRFPKEEKRRALWINAIRRENWTPSSSSRICGKHFQTGKPSSDKYHPDYVPNVFAFTKVKKTAELYEKRKNAIERRRKLKATSHADKAAGTLILIAKNSREKADETDISFQPLSLLAEDSREKADETDISFQPLSLLAEDSREKADETDISFQPLSLLAEDSREKADETDISFQPLSLLAEDSREKADETDISFQPLSLLAEVSSDLALRMKNNTAESSLLSAEGSAVLPERNIAAESSLLSAEGSAVLPERNIAAESSLLSAEGSRELPERNIAAESLLLAVEGHQTECLEVPSIEQGEKTQNLNDQSQELEQLRAKVKGYEEKITFLETQNSQLQNLIGYMDKEMKLLRNENSQLQTFIGCMDKEMKLLRNERNILQQTVLSLQPTDMILTNEKHLKLYTGLPSIDQFNWLVKIAEKHVSSTYFSKKTQLLIVLMKLKLDLLSSDIACRFQTSTTTIRRILNTWIPLLAGKLISLIKWPNARSLKKFCPQSFRHTEYRNTVCIIDCTEVPIQRASSQKARAQTWSNYKNAQTVKILVATAPAGNICFVSKAWGGRTSDKEITLRSGFMDKISSGDLIMGDRGFILEEHFREKGAKLVVPSFTRGRKQLSKHEIIYSKKIANLRIHVERIIKQIKRFRILQHKVPIIFLKHIDNIIIICAALSNLTSSVIP